MAEGWEYRLLRVATSEEAPTELNRLAADGWRVVQTTVPRDDRGVVHVLVERPLTQPTT